MITIDLRMITIKLSFYILILLNKDLHNWIPALFYYRDLETIFIDKLQIWTANLGLGLAIFDMVVGRLVVGREVILVNFYLGIQFL